MAFFTGFAPNYQIQQISNLAIPLSDLESILNELKQRNVKAKQFINLILNLPESSLSKKRLETFIDFFGKKVFLPFVLGELALNHIDPNNIYNPWIPSYWNISVIQTKPDILDKSYVMDELDELDTPFNLQEIFEPRFLKIDTKFKNILNALNRLYIEDYWMTRYFTDRPIGYIFYSIDKFSSLLKEEIKQFVEKMINLHNGVIDIIEIAKSNDFDPNPNNSDNFDNSNGSIYYKIRNEFIGLISNAEIENSKYIINRLMDINTIKNIIFFVLFFHYKIHQSESTSNLFAIKYIDFEKVKSFYFKRIYLLKPDMNTESILKDIIYSDDLISFNQLVELGSINKKCFEKCIIDYLNTQKNFNYDIINAYFKITKNSIGKELLKTIFQLCPYNYITNLVSLALENNCNLTKNFLNILQSLKITMGYDDIYDMIIHYGQIILNEHIEDFPNENSIIFEFMISDVVTPYHNDTTSEIFKKKMQMFSILLEIYEKQLAFESNEFDEQVFAYTFYYEYYESIVNRSIGYVEKFNIVYWLIKNNNFMFEIDKLVEISNKFQFDFVKLYYESEYSNRFYQFVHPYLTFRNNELFDGLIDELID